MRAASSWPISEKDGPGCPIWAIDRSGRETGYTRAMDTSGMEASTKRAGVSIFHSSPETLLSLYLYRHP